MGKKSNRFGFKLYIIFFIVIFFISSCALNEYEIKRNKTDDGEVISLVNNKNHGIFCEQSNIEKQVHANKASYYLKILLCTDLVIRNLPQMPIVLELDDGEKLQPGIL